MSSFVLRLREVRFPLRFGETLVGRSPYCSLVLSDPLISRQHAAFRVTSSGLTVQDLGSRNGTRVNGELVPAVRELRPGDWVEVGAQRFLVERATLEETTTTARMTLKPLGGTADSTSPTAPGLWDSRP